MQIGNVTINGKLALAPMAGVTDLAFRHICREHGAALTVTEMVSAKALCYQDKKTPRLLELGADEHPAAARSSGTSRTRWPKARNWRWRNPAVISSTSTWAVRAEDCEQR